MWSFHCDKLCISKYPMLICLFDIKYWHFALCIFMFKGKERVGMGREKEEKERSRFSFFFGDKLFPARMKSFHDFLHVYTCPAPCSLKPLFPFHNRINYFNRNCPLPTVPHQSTKTKFLKGSRLLFFIGHSKHNREKYTLLFLKLF